MPFLKLEAEKVIRLNDPRTEDVSGIRLSAVNSRHCHRIVFPFQDEYDVPWQKYVSSSSSPVPDKVKNLFDPSYPVNNSDIFDKRTVPFGGNTVANKIFQNLADEKSKFFPTYTNTGSLGMTTQQPIDDNLFLDHTFHAYYRHSFYRYAKFQMFKSTTEFGENPGFFIRRSLWGYFTSAALSGTFSEDIGEGVWINYRNSAKSAISAYIWKDRFGYNSWISEVSTVNMFKNNPEWVGLDRWQDYRGWLKYACEKQNAGNSFVDISSYYRQKIKEVEHLAPISAYNVMLATVVNEMYENLTQINRHISRELSLLFDTTTDSPDQPPPELTANGYITITFSAKNCFEPYYGGTIPDKLGTCGWPTMRETAGSSPDFVLTCNYGEPYLIPDYERLLTFGREDERGFPVISSYHRARPEDRIWCIATNPYDPYDQSLINPPLNPPSTERNRGRAEMYSGRVAGDFRGDGVWLGATSLVTKRNASDVYAYEPLKEFNPQRNDGCLATAYAYWCEKQYYDNGTKDSRFDLFTVSNISSQPNSSHQLLVDKSTSKITFLSCGSNLYPRQTSNRKYFPDYMMSRVRAIADKTYYPVYDKQVSEELLGLRVTPFMAQFSKADIRCLRTGIRAGTGEFSSRKTNVNEDPYYMKFRYGYGVEGESTDSVEELADQMDATIKNPTSQGQVGSGSIIIPNHDCGTKTYEGASRPVVARYKASDGKYYGDDQWLLVKEDLLDKNVEWYGDKFKFNKGVFYINPDKERWELILIGNVRHIGFTVKTDIVLRGDYGVTNRISACFWGRPGRSFENKEYETIIDGNDDFVEFKKIRGIDFKSRGYCYELPIAVKSRGYDNDKLSQISHSNMPGKTFRFSDGDFQSTFHADTAEGAWEKLMTYIHTIFPGSDDVNVYTKECRDHKTLVSWHKDFVFWIGHYCYGLEGKAEGHVLKYNPRDNNSERFFLAIAGFSFGLEYSNSIDAILR